MTTRRQPRAAQLVVQTDPAQLADDLGHLRGLRGQVEEPVAGRAPLGVEVVQALGQPIEAGVVAEVELVVGDALGQLGPGRLVDRLDARVLLHRGPDLGREGLVRIRPPGHGDQAELGRQQVRAPQLVEGRHDLAVGQVAGGAEQDEGARVRHPLQAEPCRSGLRSPSSDLDGGRRSRLRASGEPSGPAEAGSECAVGLIGRRPGRGRGTVVSFHSVLTAWPPNSLRSAARTLAW